MKTALYHIKKITFYEGGSGAQQEKNHTKISDLLEKVRDQALAAQRGPKVGSRPPGFKPVSPADCLVVTLLPTYYHYLLGSTYCGVPVVPSRPCTLFSGHITNSPLSHTSATCHTDIYADKNQTISQTKLIFWSMLSSDLFIVQHVIFNFALSIDDIPLPSKSKIARYMMLSSVLCPAAQFQKIIDCPIGLK